MNYSITESAVRNIHTFLLPWTHYLILMREKNPQARRFYEIEAYNQQWSKRQLQRQIASSLYERLALPWAYALVGLSARNNALKGQSDHSPGQAKRHPGNHIGIINEQRPERAEA